MNKRIVKHCFAVVVLSMVIVLLPALADFSVVNHAKAATWWDTVNQGGLEQVGQAYGGSAAVSAVNNDIRIVISRLIRRVLELLGIICLVIIIYAGFRWMTAGGDEEKITTAKKQLVNGIIGLVIITMAFSIATFVFYQLQYAITGIQPISWSW